LNGEVWGCKHRLLWVVDETLTSQFEKLAVCVQCVADGKTVTKFLTNVKIQAGTAVSVVPAVRDLCLFRTVRPAD